MFNLKSGFIKHFKNNLFIYFLVTVILMIGISAGVITIKILSESQRGELHSFISNFFSNIDSQKIDNVSLLKYSIFNNLKTTLVIWILGLIILGVPITLGIVLFRGFTIGFTIGFMINDFGFKGLMLALLTLIPQNIFIIPGIIIISSSSISYSINFIKRRKKNKKESLFKETFGFSFFILITCLCFIIGGIVEAYITPYLMKIIL
ncbi:stage II sporulation protein M [Clostridium sp. D2Q-11]|uniref:Stage II sporulation protein M n=1 Tax=Anaeromonas frigoriresistens TaxID=2683708 RepID=A0A942UVF5_9FIRM|nr:stage II sporulation protein M [Anaeromonas frigoriresistens]MBS4539969.1 stage II sporulation protein M [Anaeromonas frigoriresistens]